MRRLFWLGVGVAVGVTVSRRATETARQASPAGLASNVGEALRELAGAVGTFGADVRAGMSEREQELGEIVDRRSGTAPSGAVRGSTRAPGSTRTSGARASAGRGESGRDTVRDSTGRDPRGATGRHAAPGTSARRARRAET